MSMDDSDVIVYYQVKTRDHLAGEVVRTTEMLARGQLQNADERGGGDGKSGRVQQPPLMLRSSLRRKSMAIQRTGHQAYLDFVLISLTLWF